MNQILAFSRLIFTAFVFLVLTISFGRCDEEKSGHLRVDPLIDEIGAEYKERFVVSHLRVLMKSAIKADSNNDASLEYYLSKIGECVIALGIWSHRTPAIEQLLTELDEKLGRSEISSDLLFPDEQVERLRELVTGSPGNPLNRWSSRGFKMSLLIAAALDRMDSRAKRSKEDVQ